MNHLLFAVTLALFAATAAQARNLIVVEAVIKHCLEKDPTQTLIGQLNAKAEEKCIQVTGYPNAKLIGDYNFRNRVTSFGYLGCSLIQNTTISGKYECLIGNK